MRDGRGRAEWDRTAAIITHLRAVHGDKAADIRRYHPYMSSEELAAEAKRDFREFCRKVAQDAKRRSN